MLNKNREISGAMTMNENKFTSLFKLQNWFRDKHMLSGVESCAH